MELLTFILAGFYSSVESFFLHPFILGGLQYSYYSVKFGYFWSATTAIIQSKLIKKIGLGLQGQFLYIDGSYIETIRLRIVVFGIPRSYSYSPIILIWRILIAKFDCTYVVLAARANLTGRPLRMNMRTTISSSIFATMKVERIFKRILVGGYHEKLGLRPVQALYVRGTIRSIR